MPVFLRRLWIQVTADRRRFGLLMTVTAVALLLWARILVISDPPRRAVADGGGDEAVAAVVGVPPAPPRTIDITLVRELNRDPFVINPRFFPKPTPQQPTEQEQGKLVENSAEDKLRVERERTAWILGHADRLTVEAVMGGPQLAVIDGEIRRVGDVIPAQNQVGLTFTMTEVKARSVIVECEGRRIELSLKGPSGG